MLLRDANPLLPPGLQERRSLGVGRTFGEGRTPPRSLLLRSANLLPRTRTRARALKELGRGEDFRGGEDLAAQDSPPQR
ncbi:hypothetical protein AS029_02765 [Microbacterium enclense]|nr:hypothetical protein AS029_02765 [Microbacterium enclense]